MAGYLKVVCFDLDDTLWDLNRTYKRAHEAWLAFMRQVPGGMALAKAHSSHDGWEKTYATIFEDYPGIESDFSRVRKEAFRRACVNYCVDVAVVEPSYKVWFSERNRPALFDDAVALLRMLREMNLTIGAVTDTDAVVSDIPELDGLFDFVVYSAEVGVGKPDPKIFHAALQRAADVLGLPVKAEDCIMIGDNYKKDVLGAHGVGMHTVWYDFPESYPRTVLGQLAPEPPLVCLGPITRLAAVPNVLSPLLPPRLVCQAMGSYTTVLFDIDTLVFDIDDTMYSKSSGFNDHAPLVGRFMIERLGFNNIDDALSVLKVYFEEHNSSLIALAAANDDGHLPTRLVNAELYESLAEWFATQPDFTCLRLDPILIDTLRSLQDEVGLKLVAFTNSPRRYGVRCLDALGVREFFASSMIFGVEDVLPRCKPDKSSFEKVLSVVGTVPSKAVMFEDSMQNIRACKAIGMHTVLINEGETRADDPAVDAEMYSIREMRRTLPQLWHKRFAVSKF